MAEIRPFPRINSLELAGIQEAERSPLRIRWWIIPLAVLLCAAQAVVNQFCEWNRTSVTLIATQISIIAFGFLAALTLVVNPLLRLSRLFRPLSRAEVITLFSAMAVSAGISSFGLVDQLIPLIASPFNPSWNVPQRKWDVDVVPHLNPALYITDAAVIDAYRQGFQSTEGLWGKINWAAWAKPLSFWMIFVLAIYLLFYSLSALLYGPWGRREKLVFPLARLPLDLVSDDGAEPGAIPSVFRRRIFWIGFLGVFLLLSYNATCQADWLRGMTAVKLGLDQNQLIGMLDKSVFKGIADSGRYRLVFNIIFTAVGIGFLLPLEVSKSLWMYFVAALGLMMGAIWLAFGASTRSFPSDYFVENNFISSLGAGGLMAFAAVLLARAFMDRWTEARGRTEDGGRGRVVAEFLRCMGWSGVGLFLSLGVTLAWLRWNHVGLHWGMAFMAVVVLMTVGLMRMVAEGGVYWFQIHTGPFHLVNVAGGAKAVSGAVIAPLMLIYSVLFLDIKTFLAPSAVNAFKMQDESRAARGRFHLAVALAGVATVAVSCVTVLYMVHLHGANGGQSWFYSSGPQ